MGNVKKSPFSDKKSRFVKQCFDAAFTAAKAFNLNPSVIMAQAAIETGWGESNHATQSNNYFGIIACGKINAYWYGGKSAKTHRGLCFRRYDSVENSFMDGRHRSVIIPKTLLKEFHTVHISVSKMGITESITAVC